MEYLKEYQEWLYDWAGVAGVANARVYIRDHLEHNKNALAHV